VPYVATSDFIARFGQRELDQLLPTAPADDGRTFTAAEADASAIVDSYLASRPGRTYSLPLVTLPPRLLEVAADLVRYELYGHAAPEEVETRRDAAIAFLEKVAKGELTVAGLTPEPVPGEVFAVSYAAKDRVFTDDALAGF